MPSPRRVVLASTSKYRRQLLERFGMPFECADPGSDETLLAGETPAETALRLAAAKASAVALHFPDALIIGCDQIAACGSERLGKPGSHENALRQLAMMSGRTVSFETAVVVLDTRTGKQGARVVACRVTFRSLTPAQIEAYLRQEKPYDCAGSAKAEGLGIALIARMETEDPTSLIGLPLIALTELLADAGFPVLAA